MSARERIRAAIAGNCVPSIDPERYADVIASVVPKGRSAPDLSEDLQAEARRITRDAKTDGLLTRGA